MPTRPTPNDLRELVARVGAHQAVEVLNRGDASSWSFVMDRIAAGEPQWLDTVAVLKPGTDAATSEELMIVVSEALPHNPRGTLGLIPEVYSASEICLMAAIEPTADRVRAYYATAIPAVQSVTETELQRSKEECLASLRTSMRRPE